MSALCEKDEKACGLMKETTEFCRESEVYCELAGLPVFKQPEGRREGPGGGMGGPGRGPGGPGGGGRGPGGGGPGGPGGSNRPQGTPPGDISKQDMGVVGEMARSCSEKQENCESLKSIVENSLAFSKNLKSTCEGKTKDKKTCELIKESKALCSEKGNICEYVMSNAGEPEYYSEILAVCAAKDEQCAEKSSALENNLSRVRELKSICEKDAKKCEDAKNSYMKENTPGESAEK
jgi:hypothetical protein